MNMALGKIVDSNPNFAERNGIMQIFRQAELRASV